MGGRGGGGGWEGGGGWGNGGCYNPPLPPPPPPPPFGSFGSVVTERAEVPSVIISSAASSIEDATEYLVFWTLDLRSPRSLQNELQRWKQLLVLQICETIVP